jgi:hypothetical protein
MKNLSILKIVILVIIVVLIFVLFLSRILGRKELQLIYPNGREILRAGSTYQIKWRSKNIDKIDIVLVKEEEPKKAKIIAKDVPAKEKKYDWQIFVWEETGQHYRISIYETPWQEKNKIDYSDGYFTILGPKFASCDQISIENQWLFLPSDFPGLRKVFITEGSYSGNLGGLGGADQICQQEAQKKGFDGNWKAFLGDEKVSAKERLNLEGIFVFAEGEGVLPQEIIPPYFWKSFGQFLSKIKDKKLAERLSSYYKNLEEQFNAFSKEWNLSQAEKKCYPFLGKNFDEFFNKLTSPFLLEKGKPKGEFLANFRKEIWLGRIEKETKKNCIPIVSKATSKEMSEKFSFTSTCEDWATDKNKITFTTSTQPEGTELPYCYTPENVKIYPSSIGGFALTFSQIEDKEIAEFSSGELCNNYLKLLCIQQ